MNFLSRKRTIWLVLVSMLWLNLLAQEDGWTIRAQQINPADYYGITVANGMVGIVSSPDPLMVKDVVLNGVYDNYQRGRVSNILKVFNHVNMALEVDGRRISRRDITKFEQTLHMKTAEFETSFLVDDKVRVVQRMMSLRHLPYTAMIQVDLEALAEVKVTPISLMTAPDHLQDVHNYYAVIDRPHIKIPLMTSVGLSPTGQYKVAASNSFIFQEPHGQEPTLIHEDWDYNMHLLKFHKTLKKEEKYSFNVVASVISSATVADPHNEAERLTIYAKLEGRDRLLSRHRAAWEELWHGDITISGDTAEQRAIHSALYHLYSFARAGTAFSLSPMGLSGLGYNGHVFWDTELWMYPPLLMLQPEIAKSLLEYRFQRLDAAKENAFAHGYRGAMYPWESSKDGSEDTPVWALTGPFQHHISGCIGWAAWKYYQVTKDQIWLKERGFPILKEVADFWVSRVERKGPGRYEINNVIGANEWQENIDNNAFTNGMAKTVLEYASQAATVLGLRPNPDWSQVAANIPILTFPDGTTKENATYNGEDIKQADVNLLAYPLSVISDPSRVKQDLDYYAPRMSKEGPAMGPAILAVLYNQLGDLDQAHAWFKKSYLYNEVPPFGVLAETAGGSNPYFATGAGGMLQAVLAGFGGLRISDQGIISLPTKIPAHWQTLTIKGLGVEKKTVIVSANKK